METHLVKILQGRADVSKLTEENIAEYVQAKQTRDAYKTLMIVPYETAAKESGNKKVFEDSELEIKVTESSKLQHFSAKEIITLFQTTLDMSLENHMSGHQMHGVRKFNGVPAIDTGYMQHILAKWKDKITGTTKVRSISYKGNIGKAVDSQLGNLAFVNYAAPPVLDDASAACLYVAAKQQTKDIESRIIRPFERVFKSQAKTNPDKTEFDTKVYGSLAVQVKSVPRKECNYKAALKYIGEHINNFASLDNGSVDNALSFYNGDRNCPRIYVSLIHMIDKVTTLRNQEDTKMKQEVNVLYQPQEAIVFVR